MNDTTNPFSQRDYETLTKAEQSLDAVDEMIRRGRRCEINCDVADAISQEMRRKLQALRTEFFSAPSTLPQS